MKNKIKSWADKSEHNTMLLVVIIMCSIDLILNIPILFGLIPAPFILLVLFISILLGFKITKKILWE